MSDQSASSHERIAGLWLMAASAVAIGLANSRLAPAYFSVLHTQVGPLSLHDWIADALMAVFFLLVGLEVKREWFDGQLSTAESRRLPIIAAAAGMAVPALIFAAVTGFDQTLLRGWAIPAATDIAFALGVLALIGTGVPASVKLLLVAIAVIDDIGAIAIIAVFYTAELDASALVASALVLGAMVILNNAGVRRLWPYMLAFALLWLTVFASGIHATVAGVLAALTIPLGPGERRSPLKRLEHAIHPWVMFGIVPLFGLASAGVAIATWESLISPLALGIALGLFLGKQLGVFGAIWLADRVGLAKKPDRLDWSHIYAAALLCGIGFTMSLFIGELAFVDEALVNAAKIGTLLGSAMAILAAFLVLQLTPKSDLADIDQDEANEVFGEDFDRQPEEGRALNSGA